MIFSKVTEVFAESIPAGVLQAYAYIQSPKRSTSAFASILVSALTTGFGSALVSYGESLRGAKVTIIVKILSHPICVAARCRHGHLTK